MKQYETPSMETVTVSADTTIANEVDVDFGALVLSSFTPNV